MAAIGKGVPETICELCLDELRIAHAFRERCQRSSKVLLVRCRRSIKSEEDQIKTVIKKEAVELNTIEVAPTVEVNDEVMMIEVLDDFHIVTPIAEEEDEEEVVEPLGEVEEYVLGDTQVIVNICFVINGCFN